MIFTFGGRYEDAQIKAVSVKAAGAVEYDESKKHELGAADISLLYKPRQKSKVFTKLSTLYRCPFTNEQANYHGLANKFVAGLDAEKGKSAEIGSEIYFLRNLKAGLTLFRISMKNEIAWNAVTSQNENLDETKHDGIELSASWNVSKNSKLYGNYTHSAGEFTNGQYKGKKLSLVPAGKAFIGADISPARGLVLSAKASYTGNCYLSGDYDNEVSKLKDYTLLDISLRYKSENAPFSLFAGVENALNKKYSTLGYWTVHYPPPAYIPTYLQTYHPSPEKGALRPAFQWNFKLSGFGYLSFFRRFPITYIYCSFESNRLLIFARALGESESFNLYHIGRNVIKIYAVNISFYKS